MGTNSHMQGQMESSKRSRPFNMRGFGGSCWNRLRTSMSLFCIVVFEFAPSWSSASLPTALTPPAPPWGHEQFHSRMLHTDYPGMMGGAYLGPSHHHSQFSRSAWNYENIRGTSAPSQPNGWPGTQGRAIPDNYELFWSDQNVRGEIANIPRFFFASI
jgi:hypothetical protein